MVDATPISVPARVRNFSSVSRTMALVATLQIVSVWVMPRLCAWRSVITRAVRRPCWDICAIAALAPAWLSKIGAAQAIFDILAGNYRKAKNRSK